VPEHDLGEAIGDRLRRAATPRPSNMPSGHELYQTFSLSTRNRAG
jgi:hypothetical protein